MISTNNLLATLFGILAACSFIGVLTGATHLAFIFVPALFITLLFIANKKPAK